MLKLLVLIFCMMLVCPAYAKQNSKAGKGHKIPSGIEKKIEGNKKLPPGWQKKLVKGEKLSDEIVHNSTELSAKEMDKYKRPTGDAEEQLLKVENKIIRVMRGTKEILGVFDANLD